MKFTCISIVILLLSVVSSNAQAAFHCSVDINRVLIYGDGSVNILHTGRNDYTFICKLNAEWKGVSVVTCAMWTSMLQNIKKNSGKAIFYYNGNESCATLPTYGATPAAVYIGDI